MTAKPNDSKQSGINWASAEVAEQWSRTQAERDEHLAPATEMMLDLADIQAGYRVLDVGAGAGGQTLWAGSARGSERLRTGHRSFC
ncbi:MAG TPA: hypothetical protein VFU31_07060 [Candidatus Binatia bacterium]|nr:hypothetical protein [Candidatus Binatia bacterium]